MVFLNLCKDYLNMATVKMSVDKKCSWFTPDQELHMLIYGVPSYVIMYTSYAVPVFLPHHVHICYYFLQGDTSGDYKRLLLALVRGH